MNVKKYYSHLPEIHPCLREIFYKLCISGRMSLRPIILKKNISELTLSDAQYTYAYRIHIPYANTKLKWDVIFNPHDLTSTPDFDFNDVSFDDFISTYIMDDIRKYVPDWAEWDIKNSESLELVLKGFIRLFNQYQVNKLCDVDSFVSEEYHSILSLDNYTSNDIELSVDPQCSEFLIDLHIKISQLPEYTQQVDEDGNLLNPKADYALLAVSYQNKEFKRKEVQLKLSPRLDQFLRKTKKFNIPRFEKPLGQYIQDLTKVLQKHIDDVCFNLQFKREFVASLLALRSRSVLEYDSFHFKYVSFLCEVNGCYSYVQVKIGDKFPSEDSQVEIIPLHNLGSSLQITTESTFNHEESPERTPDKMALHFLQQLKTYFTKESKSDVSRVTNRRI